MGYVSEVLAHVPRVFAWALSKRVTRHTERELFLRIVERGMTVFDVGANVGEYTRLFSVLVGRPGRVHAFEPMAKTFARLTARTVGRGNVIPHQLALGDRRASMPMTVPGGDFGQASLASHVHGSWSTQPARTTAMVEVERLDDLLANQTIPPPDLIKIDVEGAERMVLEGAKTLITTHRPVLFFEVFDEWTRGFGYHPLDVVQDIGAMGYTDLFALDSAVWPLPPVQTLTRWPIAGAANILAIPSTPLGARVRRRLRPLLPGSAGGR